MDALCMEPVGWESELSSPGAKLHLQEVGSHHTPALSFDTPLVMKKAALGMSEVCHAHRTRLALETKSVVSDLPVLLGQGCIQWPKWRMETFRWYRELGPEEPVPVA
jgi:hypothetical protein